ncbi:hypothetical protein FRC17_007904, partial [Serendipita sp. 399]
MTSRRYSEEFPAGYGDFNLVSSDGVVFSISRTFLSYVSPIFRDMLELGHNEIELQVVEGSKILDQFLRFFDPLKNLLHIEWETVDALLEAARKYQVERIFTYWEQQVLTSDEDGTK